MAGVAQRRGGRHASLPQRGCLMNGSRGANRIHREILSSPASLPAVRAELAALCERIGFDDETVGKIVLSVDEALTNIIRHAYDGAADKPIVIEAAAIEAEPGGVRIDLRDFGKVVDPERIKPRDLSDVRPGGLGVHIIRECMDQVEYRPGEAGGTHLSMSKALTRQQGVRQS